MTPDTIMIFAAGHGTRMRPLTDTIPKPLVRIDGVPMIDRALRHADQAGIRRKVVNTHYLGSAIADHLQGRDDVLISAEPQAALETGGGLKQALPLLGPDPVFTINPDAVWTGGNPLGVLAKTWDAGKMDALLLLVPVRRAIGHVLGGDFTMAADQRLRRAKKHDPSAFVYTGAQILHTDLVAEIPDDTFSLNLVWDKMIGGGRLFGCVFGGDWVSVGTVDSLALAEQHLKGAADV